MKKIHLWRYVGVGVAIAIAMGAWLLYEDRTPGCDSLSVNGAHPNDAGFCVVDGSLTVKDPWDYQRLPTRLVVHGDLTITGTSILALPAGLVVDGRIELYQTEVASLALETWARDGLSQHSGRDASISDEDLAAWHERRIVNPARPTDAP